MKLRQRVVRGLRRSMLSPPPTATLSADAEAILASMYSQPQHGDGDALHPIDSATRITRDRGDLLYAYAREVKPALSIEVGLA